MIARPGDWHDALTALSLLSASEYPIQLVGEGFPVSLIQRWRPTRMLA